jgi:hypothetical protein
MNARIWSNWKRQRSRGVNTQFDRSFLVTNTGELRTGWEELALLSHSTIQQTPGYRALGIRQRRLQFELKHCSLFAVSVIH